MFCDLLQGYFPTEYNIDCFKSYRRGLDSCSRELQCELKKLNDLDLLNCDKVLKVKRRHLVRRIQVGRLQDCLPTALNFEEFIHSSSAAAVAAVPIKGRVFVYMWRRPGECQYNALFHSVRLAYR